MLGNRLLGNKLQIAFGFVKLAHDLPLLFTCAGVDSGEMEVQRQGEGEEEERRKDPQNPREEERGERSTESTIHTVPELLLDTMQVENHQQLLHTLSYTNILGSQDRFLCSC